MSDEQQKPNPTQTLTDALAAAGLSLAVGKVWLISTNGNSRIDLADILPESLRSFEIRVEVGAVPKDPV